MRRVLAVVVPLTALVAVLPAVAAPVTSGRVATVRFALPTEEGRIVVGLRAVDGSSADLLRVAVTRCEPDCRPPQYFEGAVPASAVSVDAEDPRARLDAVLGDLPLQVTWTPGAGAGVVSVGTEGGGTTDDAAIGFFSAQDAVAAVVAPAGACRGNGDVGDSARVQLGNGDGAALPLSRLRLPDVAPTCARR